MDSNQRPDFVHFIAELGRGMAERGMPYMLIGGQAVLLHGRPRLTEDIDVTLGLGPADHPGVLELCDHLGLTPLPEDVATFVTETYVLPARHQETGVRVDFIFSTTPYEQHAIERSQRVEVGGVFVSFATAEDLIIHKLFAGRPRDLDDAVGVVVRKGGELDWTYLEHWVDQFDAVPGREELPGQLADLRRSVE
jgi:hypothetical protein